MLVLRVLEKDSPLRAIQRFDDLTAGVSQAQSRSSACYEIETKEDMKRKDPMLDWSKGSHGVA